MSLSEEIAYVQKVLGLSPDTFDVVVPVILSGDGFSIWNGIAGLTVGSLVLSSSPGFLSNGHAVQVTFDAVGSFSFQETECKISFMRDGRIQRLELKSIVGDEPQLWWKLGVTLQLRLVGIPARNVAWPERLQFFCADDLPEKGLRALERLPDSCREQAFMKLWRAFLLLHLSRIDDARKILSEVFTEGNDLRLRMLAEMEISQGKWAKARLILAGLSEFQALEKNLEKICLLHIRGWSHLAGKDGPIPLFLRMSGSALLEQFRAINDVDFPNWRSLQKFQVAGRSKIIDFWLFAFKGDLEKAEEVFGELRDAKALSMEEMARFEAAISWARQDFERVYHLLQHLPDLYLKRIVWECALKLGREEEVLNEMGEEGLKTLDYKMKLALLSGSERKYSMTEFSDPPDFSMGKSLMWTFSNFHYVRMLFDNGCKEKCEASFRELEKAYEQGEFEISSPISPDRILQFLLLKSHCQLLGAEIDLCNNAPDSARGRMGAFDYFLEIFGLDRDKKKVESLRTAAQSILKGDLIGDSLHKDNFTAKDLSNLQKMVMIVKGKGKVIDGFKYHEKKLEDLNEAFAEPLVVAIIGEFNAGKSTLLNAWLGKDVLPTGVRPTTAIPCLIKYGEEESGKINYFNGSSEFVLSGNLRRYVDENVKDHGEMQISFVELFLPIAELQTVWFVDTPGLNSLFLEHQSITRNLILRSDVFIWVEDATQFGKLSEIKAFRELIPGEARVVHVINRIDEIEMEEEEELIAHAAEFWRIGAKEFFPLSAKIALEKRNEKVSEPGFERFLSHLEKRVLHDVWSLKYHSLLRKTLGVLEEIRLLSVTEKERCKNKKGEISLIFEESISEIREGLSVQWMESFKNCRTDICGSLRKVSSSLPKKPYDATLSPKQIATLVELSRKNLQKHFLQELENWLFHKVRKSIAVGLDVLHGAGLSEQKIFWASEQSLFQSLRFLSNEMPDAFQQELLDHLLLNPGQSWTELEKIISERLEKLPQHWRKIGIELEEWLQKILLFFQNLIQMKFSQTDAVVFQPVERIIKALTDIQHP